MNIIKHLIVKHDHDYSRVEIIQNSEKMNFTLKQKKSPTLLWDFLFREN